MGPIRFEVSVALDRNLLILMGQLNFLWPSIARWEGMQSGDDRDEGLPDLQRRCEDDLHLNRAPRGSVA